MYFRISFLLVLQFKGKYFCPEYKNTICYSRSSNIKFRLVLLSLCKHLVCFSDFANENAKEIRPKWLENHDHYSLK